MPTVVERHVDLRDSLPSLGKTLTVFEDPRLRLPASEVADVMEMVAGADIDRRIPLVGDPRGTFVAAVPGRSNALLVGWPGGCEERADLALEPSEFGPNFTLKLLQRPDGCDGALIPRRVIVAFEAPVQAAEFNLDVAQ